MTEPPTGPYGGSPDGQGPYGDRPRRRDPQAMETRGARANAVIRLGGLVVIVLAFLGVSQSFTSDDKPRPASPTSTTATTPGRPAVVYADEALEPVLRKIDPGASYSFGSGPQLEKQITGGAEADVFLSASKPAMRSLMAAKRCTTPVAFATRPLYSSCQVTRPRSDAAVATAYVDALTTITAREILIDAGIDVPVTR